VGPPVFLFKAGLPGICAEEPEMMDHQLPMAYLVSGENMDTFQLPQNKETLLGEHTNAKAVILPRHRWFVLIGTGDVTVNDCRVGVKLLRDRDVICIGAKDLYTFYTNIPTSL
jgi:hypothetical protein